MLHRNAYPLSAVTLEVLTLPFEETMDLREQSFEVNILARMMIKGTNSRANETDLWYAAALWKRMTSIANS